MRHIHLIHTVLAAISVAVAASGAPAQCCAGGRHASVPLPSWNDGTAKKALVDYVAKVTTKGSPDYVPPAERIAVFDNDGTLWTEQPVYFQIAFAFHQVGVLAPAHPEWKTIEPYASILKGNLDTAMDAEDRVIEELVTATHTGMTTDAFAAAVQTWLDTARHPRFNRPYTECVYQPMLEVLCYLRRHGFKTFIVSGGTADFIRVFAERVYGIPPEQVIGSSFVTRYAPPSGKDNSPALVITPRLGHYNDSGGKPGGIHAHIGRVPLLAFGNSDGDCQMLKYITGTPGRPRLGFIVHHTDSVREYAYDRGARVGSLDKAIDDAASNNWILIDMKTDWKTVHSEQ